MDFLRRAARTFKILKVINEIIRKKIGVTQTSLEKMENIKLKRFTPKIRMGNNGWSKQILSWSPEGRKRRGRPEIKW